MLFSQVIGQQAVKQKLIQSVQNNRVSHAQLFLGPEGSGKLALALAYAQYINCTNRTATDSCGQCPSCVKIAKLSHPDLHFIFPTTTTKKVKSNPESVLFLDEWRSILIENQAYISANQWYEYLGVENKQGTIYARDASEIIRKLQFKSYESGYKITIVWMVEKLNITAANKLLKLLEEPPDKTVFILIAEEQEEILPTVRSRAYLVKIPRIADESVMRELSLRYDKREADVRDAAIVAQGNWVEAIRLFENSEDEKYNYQTFQQWMRLCFRVAVLELSDFSGNIATIGREKQKSLLNYGLKVLRSGMLFNNQTGKLVKLPGDEYDFHAKFAAFVNSQNAVQMIQLMEEGITHIERNANPSILFMDTSLKMVKLLKLK